MGRFKEKLYRFMYGRYGNDHLSRFLMIVALILIVADAILRLVIPLGIVRTVVSLSVSLAAILLYVLIICRSMSRNIYKRRRENETYLKVSRGIKRFLSMNTSHPIWRRTELPDCPLRCRRR